MAMVYSICHVTVAGKLRWGYKYTDAAGKRHQVIKHPQTRRPFATRAEVVDWLRLLEAREIDRTYRRVRDIAEWLFADGSPWIERQTRRRDGRPLSPRTIEEHRRHVEMHILPQWGDTDPGELEAEGIERWLYSIDVSNRYRRAIWVTMRMVLEEFQRRRLLRGIPRIEQPRGGNKSKTALTMDQLHALFPVDRAALREVWADPRDNPTTGDKPYQHEWLKIAACSALSFFGGLRPQEARGVCIDQLCLDDGGLTVTRQVTDANEVVDYLKAADARDPRYRYALLPSFAVDLVSEWMDTGGPSWLLFPRASGEEGPITNDHLYKRVRLAYRHSGLDLKAGRYTPYSGRFTWRTLFGARLDPSVAREVMGHRDDATHQAYNVPELRDRIAESERERGVLDGVWGS